MKLIGLLVLLLVLAACSSVPSNMTVNGTVRLMSFNGVPPAQAYTGLGLSDLAGGVSDLTVNIVADDGPGNYSGLPWRQVETTMTLVSATAKVRVYRFTAQVPDDGIAYQVTADCCTDAQQSWQGDYSLAEMQAGPVLCIGDACRP